MEAPNMFDDLTFKLQRQFLQSYLKKTRDYYTKDQEKYLLKVFRHYSSSVPAYTQLLKEKGVDPGKHHIRRGLQTARACHR